MQKNKVAASVILYNSGIDCVEQIASYSNQVGKLYIIDNSDRPDQHLIQQLKTFTDVEYFSNEGNKGIANALNKAASLAIQDGFSYLLTMDDDSRVPEHMVQHMLAFIQHFKESKIGIISVAHSEPIPNTTYKYVDYTMTSGNLLNLDAYQQTGTFEDQLFIDFVDHEYNLQLKSKGFATIELANLKLDHRLGTEKSKQVMNHTISFVSHSPKRLYYLVRNGIYIVRKYMFKYPIPCLTLSALTIKEIIKSLVLEDNRSTRAKYLGRAISDGLSSRMGKLVDQ